LIFGVGNENGYALDEVKFDIDGGRGGGGIELELDG
jgi:hypothetical protein